MKRIIIIENLHTHAMYAFSSLAALQRTTAKKSGPWALMRNQLITIRYHLRRQGGMIFSAGNEQYKIIRLPVNEVT